MTSEEKAREFIATLLMTDDARFEQKVAELAAMLPADAPTPETFAEKVERHSHMSIADIPKRKRAAKPKPVATKKKLTGWAQYAADSISRRGPRLPIKKKK